MRNLDLGKYRRARIWIDDLPDAIYPEINLTTRTVVARKQPQLGTRLAAVELFVPLGARSMYGLIGGRFEPDEKNHQTIDVATSSSSGRLLENSLASNIDEVHVGLPDEYLGAVLRGINAAHTALGEIISGTLVINCGAYGIISSCEEIYEKIAVILVKLCNAAFDDVSDSYLMDLFSQYLH